MWPEIGGQEIYYDNLGDLTMDQFIEHGLDWIVDIDQHFSGNSEAYADKTKYVAVGGTGIAGRWSTITVDWAPAVDVNNPAEVRQDCSPDFDIDVYNLTEGEGTVFTCVCKSRLCDYAYAGDDVGQVHWLNILTGTEGLIVFPPQAWVVRIFEYQTDWYSAWCRNGMIHTWQADCVQPAPNITNLITYDLTAHDITEITDVCKSPGGSEFVFIGYDGEQMAYFIYYVDWLTMRAGGAPTAIQQVGFEYELRTNDYNTSPMAFIDNNFVLVMPPHLTPTTSPRAEGDTWMVNLSTGTATQINTDILDRYAFTCIGFENNGTYGIVAGFDAWKEDRAPPVVEESSQKEVIIWKIVPTLGDSPSISLTPLYSIQADSEKIYRMRKRSDRPTWFLISREWEPIMSIGEPPESPVPTVTDFTSTTIELTWSKPETYKAEEHIAYVKVMRSETCKPDDWECVFARDIQLSSLPCSYNDNQHPDLPAREVELNVYQEFGLVDQLSAIYGGAEEVDAYDPAEDTFPDGRRFFYKVQWRDYLNLAGESDIIEQTTAKPIPPVHIDDTIPLHEDYDWVIPYSNIDTEAEKFTIKWDWIEHFGEVESGQFDRWDIAIAEEWEDNVTPLYLQPGMDGINGNFIFPWKDWSSVNSTWDGDRGGVITDISIKEKEVTSLENYNGPVKYEKPIIPYVHHRCTVIGWDRGGLWRVAATSNMGKDDWVTERQVVDVRTESKPSGVINLEDINRDKTYDSDTSEFLFYDWTILDIAIAGSYAAGKVVADQRMYANQFDVTVEQEVIGFRATIDSINGNPSALRFAIYDDNAGLPNASIGTLDVAQVDVVVGNVATDYYLTSPDTITLYPGTYHLVLTTSLGAGEANGANYELSYKQYTGKVDKIGEEYNTGAWANNTDEEGCLGLICKGYAPDHIVIDSGLVDTFHTEKTTDAKYGEDSLIFNETFMDLTYWEVGGSNPPSLDGLRLKFENDAVDTTARAWLDLEEFDRLGVDTRNYIIKMKLLEGSGNCYFDIYLRTQSEFGAQMRCIRISYNIDPPDKSVFISQGENGQVFTDIGDHHTGDIFAGADTEVEIIIKVIDGGVYFYYADSSTGSAVDNMYNGIAPVKGRLYDLPAYPFVSHGRPFELVAEYDGVAATEFYLTEFEIYGLPTTNDYQGGQGYQINYGDGSDSGYFRISNIDKTYSVVPDELTKEWEAITHPINETDNEDWGMSTIDFDRDISSHTVDVQAINSFPVCDLNLQENSYIDQIVFADLSGSYDPEGGELTYDIDWGDGTTDSGDDPQFTHTYTSAGTFSVEVYVTDEYNQESTHIIQNITITELFGDLYELVPNFPFMRVSPTRADGMSIFNLPEQCGSETHATKGGSRVFDITGIHIAECCCSDPDESWVQGITMIKGTDIGELCDDDLYENTGIGGTANNVGDMCPVFTGGGLMVQQAQFSIATGEICAVDFYVPEFFINSLWDANVTVQLDVGGQPSGIPIGSTATISSLDITPGWNQWEFPEPHPEPGAPYWFVLESDPCPIGSGMVDYFAISHAILSTFLSEECAPVCIPICAWVPDDEFAHRIWGITTYDDTWVETATYDEGRGQYIPMTDAAFEDATHLKIRMSIARSADFDGDILVRLANSINPQSFVFSRGTPQVLENSEIEVYDGNEHYVDFYFIGCPDDIYGEDVYILITTQDASTGTIYVRKSDGAIGTGYEKLSGSNTWSVDGDGALWVEVSGASDCMDLAYCESELFDALNCSKEVFKVDLPYYGEIACIMKGYRPVLDKDSPNWMNYSVQFAEITEEDLDGG